MIPNSRSLNLPVGVDSNLTLHLAHPMDLDIHFQEEGAHKALKAVTVSPVMKEKAFDVALQKMEDHLVALFVEGHLYPLYFVIMNLVLVLVLPVVKYFGRTGNVAHQDNLLRQDHLEASWVSEQLEDIHLDTAHQDKDHKGQNQEDHHSMVEVLHLEDFVVTDLHRHHSYNH